MSCAKVEQDRRTSKEEKEGEGELEERARQFIGLTCKNRNNIGASG